MTATAAARLILHRAAQVRTGTDLLRIGDALGVDSSMPVMAYQVAVARRLWEMARLANTMPYRAGRYGLSVN